MHSHFLLYRSGERQLSADEKALLLVMVRDVRRADRNEMWRVISYAPKQYVMVTAKKSSMTYKLLILLLKCILQIISSPPTFIYGIRQYSHPETSLIESLTNLS
jgi:hypothetical protein